MNYVTVFDVTQHGIRYWAFMIASLLFTAFLVVINFDLPFPGQTQNSPALAR